MLKTARLFILLNSRNIHEFSLRPINNKLFNIIIIIIIINIINSNNNSMKYLASVLFTAKSKSKIAIYCPQGSGTLRQQLTIRHYYTLSCTILQNLALSCTILHYLALSCTILH